MGHNDETKDSFINERLRQILCESEKFLSNIVACAPIIMFVLNREGIFMFSGGKALDRLGLKQDELVGMSAFEVYRDKPEIVENARRVLAGKEVVFSVEMSEVTWEFLISPLHGSKAEIIGAVGFAIDITKRKKIEEALWESEQKYRDIFEKAPVAIIVTDANGQIIDVNPYLLKSVEEKSAEEMRSDLLTREDFIGQNLLTHPGALAAGFSETFTRLYKGEPFDLKEVCIAVPYLGLPRYFNVRGIPLLENDKVVGAIIIYEDITERKKAEEEYKTILRTAVDGFWLTDMQGHFLDVNEAYCLLIGYSRDELLKMKISDVEAVEDPQETMQRIQRIKETGGDRFESRHRCKDGRIVDVEVSVNYMEEADGRLFVFLRDITGRKQAEKILESQRLEQRIILDSVPAMIFYKDTQNRMLRVNRAFVETMGMPKESIEGKTCFELWPEDAEHYWSDDKEVIQSGQPKTNIIEFLVTVKGRRWVQTDKIPYRDEQGNIIGIIGFAVDITEHKEAVDALKESENKFRSLAEKSLVGIYLIQEGIFKYVNPRLAEIFGYSVEEIMDKKGPKDLTHPEDLPVVEENIRKRISGEAESVHYTARGVTKDKKIIYFEVYGTRIEYHNQPAIIGTLLDITERKKTQEALEKNERFLSDVFDSIQDGISVLGKEMNIVRVNPTMEKWYTHAMPLVGKKCYEAFHARHSPCKGCPTAQTLNTIKPAHETIPKRTPSGQTVGWLEVHSFPLVDTQTGKVKGAIEYIRDITEYRRIETERKQLTKEILISNKKLKQLVLRDPHTGLYNYHYLTEAIEAEFHRARRYAHSLSVIMLDIDYFKSINDVYGHNFGDLVLKQLAKLLKKMVRRYDVVVRSGGEEFVVISPGTDRATALVLAQRTMDAINLYNFGDKKNTIKLKLSLAVASYPEDRVLKGIELIELADQILSKVKEYGGNKVYSSQEIKKRKQPALTEKGGETSEVRSLKERIDKLTKQANQSLIESVFAFAKTIELKDHYSGEHVERTVHYATEISQALKLPKEEIERVRQAAILHDLGKVGISEKILLKKSKLTKKEFEEIKKHPQIGVDIIRPIQFLHSIIPLILYHHERWDGKGYPTGLKGEDIPIGARIIAIADVYQALTSDRPYRKAYSEDKAIRIIKEGSGTQFDPRIVDAFFEILRK